MNLIIILKIYRCVNSSAAIVGGVTGVELMLEFTLPFASAHIGSASLTVSLKWTLNAARYANVMAMEATAAVGEISSVLLRLSRTGVE